MPAGNTDYVPWRSMREQGMDVPLVPSATPAKLIVQIAVGDLPQGENVAAGVEFVSQRGCTDFRPELAEPPRPSPWSLVSKSRSRRMHET